MHILIAIVIGGVVGWLASLIMKTDKQMGLLAKRTIETRNVTSADFKDGVLVVEIPESPQVGPAIIDGHAARRLVGWLCDGLVDEFATSVAEGLPFLLLLRLVLELRQLAQ